MLKIEKTLRIIMDDGDFTWTDQAWEYRSKPDGIWNATYQHDSTVGRLINVFMKELGHGEV